MTATALTEEKAQKPVFEIRGRIQAEAALISQSNNNSAIYGPIEDGVGFRRARLGAQGYVGDQVRWIAEFDFAGGDVKFRDVFIAAQDLPWVGETRVGNFREPFSLEGATSSNVMTFVERSTANVMDPTRHWGVGLFNYTENERLTLQGGVFRSGSSSTGNDIYNGNDMQYTVRVTGLPWRVEEQPYLLHIGGAFSQQYAKNDTITYNQGPQSTLLTVSDNPGTLFSPTITLNASQQQLYNIQTALLFGSLSLQAECNMASIDQLTGGPVFFWGGYAQASLFLTGEHRQYLAKTGAFGGPKVLRPFLCKSGQLGQDGGLGAWEIAARIGYIDYSSPNIPPSNGLAVGNRVADVTFGLNWYLNDNTRLMFNCVPAVPVDPNFGPSAATAFFISAQIYW